MFVPVSRSHCKPQSLFTYLHWYNSMCSYPIVIITSREGEGSPAIWEANCREVYQRLGSTYLGRNPGGESGVTRSRSLGSRARIRRRPVEPCRSPGFGAKKSVYRLVIVPSPTKFRSRRLAQALGARLVSASSAIELRMTWQLNPSPHEDQLNSETRRD